MHQVHVSSVTDVHTFHGDGNKAVVTMKDGAVSQIELHIPDEMQRSARVVGLTHVNLGDLIDVLHEVERLCGKF